MQANRVASEASSSRFHSVNGCSVARSTSAKCREEPIFVELTGLQREREVVAVPEVTRRLIAQPGKLPHVSGDLGSDLLRGIPRCTPLGGIVARAQDLGDRVVVDPAAVDLPAKVVEGGLHAGLELDDGAPQILGHLLRHERVVQEVEPATQQRVSV